MKCTCISSISFIFTATNLLVLSWQFSINAFSFSHHHGNPLSLDKQTVGYPLSSMYAFNRNQKKGSEPDQADKDAFSRFTKAQRYAGADDRIVELKRPLGLVLNEEDETGNVYVELIAPRGNAARTGLIKEGDIITMCSATFGDEMWSCRGVGLQRVLSAIKVRSGPTVKLVFESPNETATKVKRTAKAQQAAEDARIRAQEKRDELLKELEQDEQRLKKGWFFGLF